MNLRNFFSELKRRNVYKVAIAYAVVGWLVIQVSSTILPTFHVPEWVVQTLIVIVALGFPIALVIAWAFEMTPQGMKRTEEVGANEVVPQWSGRKFAALIVAVAFGAAALLAFQLLQPKAQLPSPSAVQPANIPAKSIAILPFVNMSSDRENEYFVDGLTEEILNRLAQISALRVPGRTSSFAFKGKNTDLRQIGTELGVAHVLEGSARKSGDRLRITAQLVRTADGFHLWSQTFDRKFDDIFAIQEEIARAIADALSTPLGFGDAVSPQRQTRDMEAYEKFLEARALIPQRSAEKLRRAIDLLTTVVERDPTFANGWAALAQARALGFYYALAPMHESLKGAEEAARKALAIDDTLAAAHSALADVLRDRFEWLAAETEYQRALKLSPGEAETHNQYAQMLLKVGHLDAALEHALRACELDPLAWVPPSVATIIHLSRGDFAKSREFLDRSEKLTERRRSFQIRVELLYALCRRDRDLARRALAQAPPPQTEWAHPPSLKFIQAADQALAAFNSSPASPLDLAKVIRELQASGDFDTGLPFSAVAVFVGQKEAALDALFLEVDTTRNDIAAMIWTPIYQPLRSEPRVLNLLRTMKLPEYWRAAGWSDFCRPKGEKDFECTMP